MMFLKKVASSACNSHDRAVFLETASTLQRARGLCVNSAHHTKCYWKVCLQGLRFTNPNISCFIKDSLRSDWCGVVEHTLVSSWTPLRPPSKELFYPPLPLHHQGERPHGERGKKGLRSLGKTVLTLQIPWKYLRDSRGPMTAPTSTALWKCWGYRHSFRVMKTRLSCTTPREAWPTTWRWKKQLLVVYVSKWSTNANIHRPPPPHFFLLEVYQE